MEKMHTHAKTNTVCETDLIQKIGISSKLYRDMLLVNI